MKTPCKHPPMSFDSFNRYLSAFRHDDKLTEGIYRVSGGNIDTVGALRSPNAVIDLLSEIFHDVQNGWIDYFVFELDYGTKYRPGMITQNGKDIRLLDEKDLYNLLVQNYMEDEANES